MTARRNSSPSAKPPNASDEAWPSTSSAGRGRRRVRRPVLFGLILGMVAGGLVILWPFFRAAESALARGLVMAVFLLSLGLPLLLLRSILRRRPSRNEEDIL